VLALFSLKWMYVTGEKFTWKKRDAAKAGYRGRKAMHFNTPNGFAFKLTIRDLRAR
jgi:hypothetical protein